MSSVRFLLDQNVPLEVASWLRESWPEWTVWHATEVGLAGKPDPEVGAWAQAHAAVVITFDEDFADPRQFPPASHVGVVRLRLHPTTVEATVAGLVRLLETYAPADLAHCLTIVDRNKIRRRIHTVEEE